MCNLTYLWLIIFFHYGFASEIRQRVYNGQKLRPNVHPYLVKLHKNNVFLSNTSQYPTLCSGTIINQHWIISAAHCFKIKLLKLNYVVVKNLDSQILGNVSQSDITIFPGYEPEEELTYSMIEKDLALLKMRESIKFDLHTRPISLVNRRPKIGDAVVITGHGRAERGVSVPREGHTFLTKCTESNIKTLCTQSIVKAGNGDSGGPLVSKGRLIGITSAGCIDVETKQPCETIFVDVYLRLKWIKKVIKNATGSN